MASIFGHGFSAYAFSKFFPTQINKRLVVCAGIFSSMLPDADMLSFRMGIPYEHMYGHRGFTHSIFFALSWATILLLLLHFKRIGRRTGIFLWLYYFICTLSHGILDSMTTGGRGIAFFAPFSDERYFLPWRIIQVSPIHLGDFFGNWGLEVIESEFFWIFLPGMAIIVISKFFR